MIPVPAAAARSTKSAAAKINDQRLFTNRNRSIKIRAEFDKKIHAGIMADAPAANLAAGAADDENIAGLQMGGFQ